MCYKSLVIVACLSAVFSAYAQRARPGDSKEAQFSADRTGEMIACSVVHGEPYSTAAEQSAAAFFAWMQRQGRRLADEQLWWDKAHLRAEVVGNPSARQCEMHLRWTLGQIKRLSQ